MCARKEILKSPFQQVPSSVVIPSSRSGLHPGRGRPHERIPHSLQLPLQHIRIALHGQVGPFRQSNSALPPHRYHRTRTGRRGRSSGSIFRTGNLPNRRAAKPSAGSVGLFVIHQRGSRRRQSIPTGQRSAFAGRWTDGGGCRRSTGYGLAGVHANALVKDDPGFGGDRGQSGRGGGRRD